MEKSESLRIYREWKIFDIFDILTCTLSFSPCCGEKRKEKRNVILTCDVIFLLTQLSHIEFHLRLLK